MKRRNFIKQIGAISGGVVIGSYSVPCNANNCFKTTEDNFVLRRYKVLLPEAHIGNLDIDTRLMDSYGLLPENIRNFYLTSRNCFSKKIDADFTDPEIINAAHKNKIPLMGGPMLSKLKQDEVSLWLRPATDDDLLIKVTDINSGKEKLYKIKDIRAGVEQRIKLNKLNPGVKYKYSVFCDKNNIAEGNFTTSPSSDEKGVYRISFGSCFHKIGLHNPNLTNQIVKRKPLAMMLLGDIATDDRENKANMLRSDYMLRDVAKSWKDLASNVSLYASWDDHDYFNDDISGIPKGFTAKDVDLIRSVWHQNWNNPENEGEGLYFSTRIGPVELIMPDTRSCRERERKGEYGCYLGNEQQQWLKKTLKESTAPFKIISSGTMWCDNISKGKDSWGTWDNEAREDIFNFIEKKNIKGVLLISGDRHGARGFTIPRPSGYSFYEFEVAALGGVRGPEAIAKDHSNQLFGYLGIDIIAFGEFTFDTTGDKPLVTFRLIDEHGNIREEYKIPYKSLTPMA